MYLCSKFLFTDFQLLYAFWISVQLIYYPHPSPPPPHPHPTAPKKKKKKSFLERGFGGRGFHSATHLLEFLFPFLSFSYCVPMVVCSGCFCILLNKNSFLLLSSPFRTVGITVLMRFLHLRLFYLYTVV